MESQRHSKRWRWLILLVPLLLAAGFGYWYFMRPVAVRGAPARIGPAVDVVYATGFVEPEQPVEVAARVTAPVVEVVAREGDRVVRGQILARLEDSEQRQLIAQLSAQTASAAFDERRTGQLYRRGFAAAAAYDRAATALRATRAGEAAARARLDQYVLRAGIAGVVLRRDVEPGDLATPSRTLFVLGDPSRIKVTATVDERDIPRVRVGQAALMSTDAYPGRVVRGRVREVTPGGDPSQRAFRVRIEPLERVALPVGLTLEVNIVTRQQPRALLVPASSVQGGKVWIVDGKRIQPVAVRTGIAGSDATEILAGIRPGDCVVSDPSDALKPGARVAVTGC